MTYFSFRRYDIGKRKSIFLRLVSNQNKNAINFPEMVDFKCIHMHDEQLKRNWKIYFNIWVLQIYGTYELILFLLGFVPNILLKQKQIKYIIQYIKQCIQHSNTKISSLLILKSIKNFVTLEISTKVYFSFLSHVHLFP